MMAFEGALQARPWVALCACGTVCVSHASFAIALRDAAIPGEIVRNSSNVS